MCPLSPYFRRDHFSEFFWLSKEGKQSYLLGERGTLVQRSNSITVMPHHLHAAERSHSIYKLNHELCQVTLAYMGSSLSKKEKGKTRFSLLVRKIPGWIRERKKQSQTAQPSRKPISFLSLSGQVNRLLFACLALHTWSLFPGQGAGGAASEAWESGKQSRL